MFVSKIVSPCCHLGTSVLDEIRLQHICLAQDDIRDVITCKNTPRCFWMFFLNMYEDGK